VVDRTVVAYRTGAVLSRLVPAPVANAVAERTARALARRDTDRRQQVERNLRRIHGPDLTPARLDAMVGKTFASYARYYAESFRLPSMSRRAIDLGFTHEGFDNVTRAIDDGIGPILVMPHLGSWEWAGFWLTAVQDLEVTAVVEALEPPELFDWFVAFREELGMHVIPVGDPSVGGRLLRAIRDRHVICLLSDRLVGEGAGVEVEFFGETTMLPAGPATLALRTGAPLIPTAVYQRPRGTHGVCRAPVPAEREGKLRADVTRVTQALAVELETLIRAAPEQWHLMQPNWPSDHATTSDGGPAPHGPSRGGNQA